ncbi:MAG TPA: 2-oxoacid:acceptor oxidoreductase family protein, partial [Candidatus Paceibacterota bacterium]|nr:2-oxoacid:acceptor oxidoreductase family protein [Candidatus Paceibacterota bacterium]
MSRSLDNVLTVSVGGAAGDGVREAGTTLGTLLTNVGFHTFMSFKYPSLIRGGHNYARISFAKEKIFYDYPHVDVLVALNEDTIKKQRHRLNPDGIILGDAFD